METSGDCVAIPCCQDCQECGFNRTAVCVQHDPTACNYTCKFADECTLGTTPFDTGYTVIYGTDGTDGRTEDAACCGVGGDNCTCFTYTLAAGGEFALDNFILNLKCPELQICSDLSSRPCLDSVLRDGVPISNVFITDENHPNAQTKLFGITLAMLGIFHDFAEIVIKFQGHIAQSDLPITYSASAKDPNSEHFTCLIDTTLGPACVDCEANPNRLMAFGRKTLQSFEEGDMSLSDNAAGGENRSMMMAFALTVINLFALMGVPRK